MKNRLINALTFFSLLLAIATAALWVRSYRWADSVGFQTVERVAELPPNDQDHFAYTISSHDGGLVAIRRRGTIGMAPDELAALPQVVGERSWRRLFGRKLRGRVPTPIGLWGRLGFRREHIRFFHAGNMDAIDAFAIPDWLLCCAFLILPTARFVSSLARQRQRAFPVVLIEPEIRSDPSNP